MGRLGQKQNQDRKRPVYVAQFGSHRCGRQALGAHGPGFGDRCDPERREATAKTGVLDTRRSSSVPESSASASAFLKLRKPREGSGSEPPARAGLAQKDAARTFDFPIPLHEVSKILKKKKKVSVWNKVYKVISKMIEENENYRHRLRCQNLSSENSK
uniref:uncharacterized protein C5orf47 homolog n=1 Tax=Jaculus jaculus TaxID=51337 RepID=UPI001E1B5438|nr:uncharacterized protein C5orf47 homolog [Jaculus jaculus]